MHRQRGETSDDAPAESGKRPGDDEVESRRTKGRDFGRDVAAPERVDLLDHHIARYAQIFRIGDARGRIEVRTHGGLGLGGVEAARIGVDHGDSDRGRLAREVRSSLPGEPDDHGETAQPELLGSLGGAGEVVGDDGDHEAILSRLRDSRHSYCAKHAAVPQWSTEPARGPTTRRTRGQR
ncbi:hypothetical protein GCM10025867_42660 [Frondihabitans sucicola]|uniref:Uncharacterized protein n=1 Tax=Frondihabitans sucicola TaxID=1268041 RepID=A0ABM8GU73_9MICO|nr:hypothetical protein GCM10025867_42660 [Frondihabitans sucicola]